VIDTAFWKNKKVFITGHTGFKGGWLCLVLYTLGAEVYGYSLRPPTNPCLFEICKVRAIAKSKLADVRNLINLKKNLDLAAPEIVIHMAAQSLVRESYSNPVDTYSVNVMGTVNILEAVRGCSTVKAFINVTSDKCYENREWIWSYRENEALGGSDPYSSSKASSEIVTAAYRHSFFNPAEYKTHGVALATARAGNVIGGGDWARDRLIPDCIRAVMKKDKIVIRNPEAIRPWQHVLEPLTGYLQLAENLFKNGPHFAEAWNFGPDEDAMKPVSWIAQKVSRQLGGGIEFQKKGGKNNLHEAHILRLDSTKARQALGWRPRWNLNEALDMTVDWYKAYMDGKDMRKIAFSQIREYFGCE
jgi:CDP-glucose 4,6-dehydratase